MIINKYGYENVTEMGIDGEGGAGTTIALLHFLHSS